MATPAKYSGRPGRFPRTSRFRPAARWPRGKLSAVAPQIILDDAQSTAASRWRTRRALTGLPLLGLLLLNTLRLGMVDHLWTLAVGMDVAIVAALPVVVRWLRRRDTAATASGPPGTLFAGGFSLSIRQLGQPRFARGAQAVGRGRWGTGYVSGRLLLLPERIRLESKPRLTDDVASIAASDLAIVELTKVPAKANGAGLDLTFTDGARLSVEVRQYDRLRSALQMFGGAN